MAQAQRDLAWAQLERLKVAPGRARATGYKRPLDLVLASVLLVVAAPLFGLIALIVKLSSRGPVFFRQERMGMGGRPFTIVKFRTMYADVDHSCHREYFARYMKGESAPGEASNVFKLRSDPRITPFGGVLRRLGLDELPQLLNVMSGDMSLVGPRPPLEYEVVHYDRRHLGRLNIKPGLTGLWQIRGRDMVDFESMVEMDLEYIRDMSLLLDLKILVMTVPSLLLAFVSR